MMEGLFSITEQWGVQTVEQCNTKKKNSFHSVVDVQIPLTLVSLTYTSYVFHDLNIYERAFSLA